MMAWGKSQKTYLLVVRYENRVESEIEEKLSALRKRIKTKSSDGETTEITCTVRLKNEDILPEITRMDGVQNALLMAYTGDAQY